MMAGRCPLNTFFRGLTSNTRVLVHFTTGVPLSQRRPLPEHNGPDSEERDKVKFIMEAGKGEWTRRKSCKVEEKQHHE